MKIIINTHSVDTEPIKSDKHGYILSAYQICGCVGFVLAVCLAAALLLKLNLHLWMLLVMILSGVITFFLLAVLTKIVTGRESLIYYHHEIAILLATAACLKITRQPVLPYLDIMILGIGTFLICGRMGCFMAGCCHGRPHRWGVCYGQEHANAGFSSHLVGVRLFPVQILESLFVLVIVIIGTGLVLGSAYRPGEALAWYSMAYGVARFFFEFLRGDPFRPYFSGFSEAQWTSLIIVALVVLGEFTGTLPFRAWHTTAFLFIALTAIAMMLARRFSLFEKYDLLQPAHVREIAHSINTEVSGSAGSSNIDVRCTSMGIQISQGRIVQADQYTYHYALSRKNSLMTEKTAKILSDLILKLKHPLNSAKVIKGHQGLFHVLIAHD